MLSPYAESYEIVLASCHQKTLRSVTKVSQNASSLGESSEVMALSTIQKARRTGAILGMM